VRHNGALGLLYKSSFGPRSSLSLRPCLVRLVRLYNLETLAYVRIYKYVQGRGQWVKNLGRFSQIWTAIIEPLSKNCHEHVKRIIY